MSVINVMKGCTNSMKSLTLNIRKHLTIFSIIIAMFFVMLKSSYALESHIQPYQITYNPYTISWVYNVSNPTNATGTDTNQYYIDVTIGFSGYYSGTMTLNHTNIGSSTDALGFNCRLTSNSASYTIITFENVNSIYIRYVLSQDEYRSLVGNATLANHVWTNDGNTIWTINSASAGSLTKHVDGSSVDYSSTLGTISTSLGGINNILGNIYNNTDNVEPLLQSILDAIGDLDISVDNSYAFDILSSVNSFSSKFDTLLNENLDNTYLEWINNVIATNTSMLVTNFDGINKTLLLSNVPQGNNSFNRQGYKYIIVTSSRNTLNMGYICIPITAGGSRMGSFYVYGHSAIYKFEYFIDSSQFVYNILQYDFVDSHSVKPFSSSGNLYVYGTNDNPFSTSLNLSGSVSVDNVTLNDSNIIQRLDYTNDLLVDILNAINDIDINVETNINNDITNIENFENQLNISLPNLQELPNFGDFNLDSNIWSVNLEGVVGKLDILNESIVSPIYQNIIVPMHLDIFIKMGLFFLIVLIVMRLFV